MSDNERSVQKIENARPASAPLVRLCGAVREYMSPAGPFQALTRTDLELFPGELVVVRGSSGSGKSTVLNLIAGLDRPTSGEVWVREQRLGALDESQLAAFRGGHIGIVFQFFQLLPTLNVLENLLVAMDLVGRIPRHQRRPRAIELLRRMDIEEQRDKFPDALSGGQQQRVAIARALANDPCLIVADEPTGNLDRQNASLVFGLLRGLADQGKAVLVVTHEQTLDVVVDRWVVLQDGRIVAEPASTTIGLEMSA